MYIHPVISVKQMGFCILIRFSWEFWLKWDQFRCITCCPCCVGWACCSCCCRACCPAWAWAGGVGCQNTLHLWSWLCHILFIFDLHYVFIPIYYAIKFINYFILLSYLLLIFCYFTFMFTLFILSQLGISLLFRKLSLILGSYLSFLFSFNSP